MKALRVCALGSFLWLSHTLLKNELWVLTTIIILLGVIFEKASHAVKHSVRCHRSSLSTRTAFTQISEMIGRHRCLQVPKTYLPVVQAMLNELGGLGFISTTVLSSAMLRSACRADPRESGTDSDVDSGFRSDSSRRAAIFDSVSSCIDVPWRSFHFVWHRAAHQEHEMACFCGATRTNWNPF
jgi:hypothetical protein